MQIFKDFLYANSGKPDQMPRFAASDLVLHCLPMSHKKDARHIWVKFIETCEKYWIIFCHYFTCKLSVYIHL